MATKHIVADTQSLVTDSLSGLVYGNPTLALDLENKVIYRAKLAQDQVHIVSGGGSGHEPAHAAFVGEGILSAAVCGQVFASPNSKQVSSALDRLAVGKGTLVVVKNYTGDVLQFGLAKERFSALNAGNDSIRMVVVGEDVAVGREQGGIVGRRGLAATVLVYKIAGALAAQGGSLNDVHAVAQYVADNSVTIGVGLEHCHVPGNESESSHLAKDEVEIGMGIHNEPGNRTAKFSSTSSLVGDLMHSLTDSKDKDRNFVKFSLSGSDNVILLVNNLGGLSDLELGVALKEAGSWCSERKINVKRAISGTFMTSLNMPGFSISLVRLPEEDVKVSGYSVSANALLELLDAEGKAPAWKYTPKNSPAVDMLSGKGEPAAKSKAPSLSSKEGPAIPNIKKFVEAVTAACKSGVAAERELTEYDSILGDGDCGMTLKAGCEGVLARIDELESDNLASAFMMISEVAEEKMGGTSGALYSIFFNALAAEFAKLDSDAKTDAAAWSKALEATLNKFYGYTRARPPSRTLVDPLSSFILTFANEPDNLAAAYHAAQQAQEATATLDAKAGRAAYIEKSKVSESKIPDAGATGVIRLLDGLVRVIV